jgi:[ribosomal protein S5]-alanine N-acetyltransferase
MALQSQTNITLRRWQTGDEVALVKYANNYAIFKNVRDTFPYPYSWHDAEHWIKLCQTETIPTVFAIDLNHEAVGGIGIVLGQDIHRCTAEIGYWLGEPFWGMGIMTQAIEDMSNYAFRTFDIHRLYAAIFEYNQASMSAVKKAGFVFETVLKQCSIKENILWDDHIYVKFKNA